MLLSEVKASIEKKITIAGGLRLPDDDVLESVLYEAMIFVALKTIPVELARNANQIVNEEILRHIRDGILVVKPEYPDFKNKKLHMQMDEDLNYAVINKTCALLSKDSFSLEKFESQALRVINIHKVNAVKMGQK